MGRSRYSTDPLPKKLHTDVGEAANRDKVQALQPVYNVLREVDAVMKASPDAQGFWTCAVIESNIGATSADMHESLKVLAEENPNIMFVFFAGGIPKESELARLPANAKLICKNGIDDTIPAHFMNKCGTPVKAFNTTRFKAKVTELHNAQRTEDDKRVKPDDEMLEDKVIALVSI